MPKVDSNLRSLYSREIQVSFTPEQEAELSRIALHAGMDAAHRVKYLALRAVEESVHFRGAVREELAESDRGELIDGEQVLNRLEQRKQGGISLRGLHRLK